MGLVEQGKIIIEVGINESASKARNPNVPYVEDEAIPDIIAAAKAGASIVHFHSRDAEGNQLWESDDYYRTVMSGVNAEVQPVMYPTYFGSHSHIWALDDNRPLGPRMSTAPFDIIQGVGQVAWNPAANDFIELPIEAPGGPRPTHPPVLAEMYRRGIVPTVASFDLRDVRWAVLAARAGILRAPISLKLFLCESWISGPWPTPEGIDAYISQLPTDIDFEAVVVPLLINDRETTEKLLRHALEKGLHIRVGVGDNPVAFPTYTNANLVEMAVGMLIKYGYEPATSADVRARWADTELAVAGTGGTE
jgi:3-keto-5-aminohexanoate cleavage enzyme